MGGCVVKMGRRLLVGLLTLGMSLAIGCGKGSQSGNGDAPRSSGSSTPSAAQSPTDQKLRHHRIFTGGVSPLIVSMAPDTIRVHDGHASLARYSLSYEINNSEKATKAMITINAPGLGQIQQIDVDVQPSRQIEFLLDASEMDLGPTVRLRAHCPFGDTDWFVMGSLPQDYPQRMSSQQIGSVNPDYVPRPSPHGGLLPITIWGGQITANCKPEAQVDFSAVELQNVVATDKRINAGLPYQALEGRPVAVRHLEVNLVVYGPGMPAADVYNLNFVE
jgi:hypothetical protein